MILVAGATGFLGREICRLLTAAGQPVRALTRSTSDPDVVSQLRAWGAEIAVGDLKDRSSLDRACAGIDAVITTATATRSRQQGDSLEASDQQGQLNLVEAAHRSGASRFVMVSVTAVIDTDDPLTTAKRTVEDAIRRSGMRYTILRPGVYMESWLGPAIGFDYASGKVTLYGDGTEPISWISLYDVAQYAVESLVDPAADDAVLELGGPEQLSPLEAVRIFEEVAGRRFEVQTVPEEALQAQAAAATDPLQQAFAALMLRYAHGCVVPVNQQIRRGATLRTVRDYARSVLSPELPTPPAV